MNKINIKEPLISIFPLISVIFIDQIDRINSENYIKPQNQNINYKFLENSIFLI